jgi:hypothetical protein
VPVLKRHILIKQLNDAHWASWKIRTNQMPNSQTESNNKGQGWDQWDWDQKNYTKDNEMKC